MKTLNCIRHCMLMLAICATAALGACLPDDKDPAVNQTSGAGHLGGPSYYAAGLGNAALKIQNAVVSDPSWFASLSAGFELNLANIGISAETMGVEMKSYVCPTGAGAQVQQVTWIESRDSAGKFTVKGLGTDAGTIIGALRTRLASDQVGVYQAGSTLAMADGNNHSIPSTCGNLSIPVGAPVVVFNIERPAPPTNELARTEYRTTACGADSGGRDRRGTLVQKRVIRYNADGSINAGVWETENMGECVDDVVVQITERNTRNGGAAADLSNFAAVALRNILTQQLQMDCSTTSVRSDADAKVKSKRIDTCNTRATGGGIETIDDSDIGDGTDTRTIQCAGSTQVSIMRFVNLRGNGSSVTGWNSGYATIVRIVDRRLNDDGSVDTQRRKWVGQYIGCVGGETFDVACSRIPGEPALEGRKSGSKWRDEGINGWVVNTNWWSSTFGCWLGGCTKVIGGYLRYLNPDYFTGTDQLQNGGTITYRDMEARSWINPETFLPNTQPASAWVIKDNQCLWSQRVMVVECPFNYDSTQQANWSPGTVSPYQELPVALDPGIGNNGTKAGEIYVNSLVTGSVGNGVTVCNSKGCHNVLKSSFQNGRLTSTVALQWEKCNIKGCDRWWEYAGPREGAYIKAWTNKGNSGNKVVLSGAAMLLRESLCNDIAFKLDATTALTEAQQRYDQLQANQVYLNSLNTAKAVYNSMATTLAQANATVTSAQNAVNTAQTNANNKRTIANQKRAIANDTGEQDDIDAAEAAEAAADAADANLATKQTALSQAQTAKADAEASLEQAEQARDAAQEAYDQHMLLVDAAYKALQEARENANAGTGSSLSADQRATLNELRSKLCTTRNQALGLEEQDMTLSICRDEHKNPSNYQYLPTLSNYCEAVFNYSGNDLSFKQVNNSTNAHVQTTLLNRDGVRLAFRPKITENKYLTVTQHGVVDQLHCARNEEKYHTWPVVKYYLDCGGKGGCKTRSYNTTTTITESTVREWAGYSYETGTWSRPSYGLRSPYGNWSNWNQVPNPITTW